jgi:hypothetical protein
MTSAYINAINDHKKECKLFRAGMLAACAAAEFCISHCDLNVNEIQDAKQALGDLIKAGDKLAAMIPERVDESRSVLEICCEGVVVSIHGMRMLWDRWRMSEQAKNAAAFSRVLLPIANELMNITDMMQCDKERIDRDFIRQGELIAKLRVQKSQSDEPPPTIAPAFKTVAPRVGRGRKSGMSEAEIKAISDKLAIARAAAEKVGLVHWKKKFSKDEGIPYKKVKQVDKMLKSREQYATTGKKASRPRDRNGAKVKKSKS